MNAIEIILIIIISPYVLKFLFILYCLIRFDKSNSSEYSKDTDLYNATTDKQYKNYIYQNSGEYSRQSLEQIFSLINEISKMTNEFKDEINAATFLTTITIIEHADEVESQIRANWCKNENKKEFAYFIGLHYASHLLSNAIKCEQIKVKNAFVTISNQRNQLSQRIESLKEQFKNASYLTCGSIGNEISDVCIEHKQLSDLSSCLGEVNYKMNERVTRQNIETAKRREFVANNFGERGIDWKTRMLKRTIFRSKI